MPFSKQKRSTSTAAHVFKEASATRVHKLVVAHVARLFDKEQLTAWRAAVCILCVWRKVMPFFSRSMDAFV